jgi:hypothetical protein
MDILIFIDGQKPVGQGKFLCAEPMQLLKGRSCFNRLFRFARYFLLITFVNLPETRELADFARTTADRYNKDQSQMRKLCFFIGAHSSKYKPALRAADRGSAFSRLGPFFFRLVPI